MKRALLILTAAAFLFALTFPASAGSLTVPNTFTQGSPAFAASVNDNFTAVETEVTDNANNIAANAASIIQNRLDISGNSLAITSHTHTAGDITSGTFGNSYFSAYSDLGTEGYLDNNSGGDLLTRIQSDSRYSSTSHSHAIGDLTGWPLDTGYFSAYSDLSAEGYLDNNNPSDVLTQGQGDGRYVRSGVKPHSYYSVSPADCAPENEAYSYTLTNSGLDNGYGLSSNYYCAVHLPHNATAQSITVAWTDDNGSANGNASLYKWSTPTSQITMASVDTLGLSSFGLRTDSITIIPSVNNSTGPYILFVNLPATNITFHYATIQYQESLN